MAQASSIPRGPLPPGIRLQENVYITMRDGVKISVDIYSPEAQGRYPAILSISPYLKELQQWPPQIPPHPSRAVARTQHN